MTTPEQKEQLRRDVFAEVFDMLRHVASREPHRESLDTKAHRLTDAIMKHTVGALEPASVAPDRPALADTEAETHCKVCRCRTGGGEFCFRHKPFMTYPQADGTFISDHCGRKHVYTEEASIYLPADRPALEALIAEAEKRLSELSAEVAECKAEIADFIKEAQAPHDGLPCEWCDIRKADASLITRLLEALPTSTGRAPEGETPAPDATTPGTEP